MRKGFNSKKKYKEINIGPFVVRIDLQNFNVNYDLLLYQGKNSPLPIKYGYTYNSEKIGETIKTTCECHEKVSVHYLDKILYTNASGYCSECVKITQNEAINYGIYEVNYTDYYYDELSGYYYKTGTTEPIFGIVGGTKRIYENIVNKNRIRKEISFYERITSIHNYNEYNYDNLGNLIKIESKTIKNNIVIKVDELTLETIGNIQSIFSSENKLEIEFDNENEEINKLRSYIKKGADNYVLKAEYELSYENKKLTNIENITYKEGYEINWSVNNKVINCKKYKKVNENKTYKEVVNFESINETKSKEIERNRIITNYFDEEGCLILLEDDKKRYQYNKFERNNRNQATKVTKINAINLYTEPYLVNMRLMPVSSSSLYGYIISGSGVTFNHNGTILSLKKNQGELEIKQGIKWTDKNIKGLSILVRSLKIQDNNTKIKLSISGSAIIEDKKVEAICNKKEYQELVIDDLEFKEITTIEDQLEFKLNIVGAEGYYELTDLRVIKTDSKMIGESQMIINNTFVSLDSNNRPKHFVYNDFAELDKLIDGALVVNGGTIVKEMNQTIYLKGTRNRNYGASFLSLGEGIAFCIQLMNDNEVIVEKTIISEMENESKSITSININSQKYFNRIKVIIRFPVGSVSRLYGMSLVDIKNEIDISSSDGGFVQSVNQKESVNYNSDNQVSSKVSEEKDIEIYDYYNDMQIEKIDIFKENTVSWEYDNLNRLSAVYCNNYSFTYYYGENDKLIKEVDSFNHQKEYMYDSNDSLVKIKDEIYQETTYEYTARDLISKIKFNNKQNVITYENDMYKTYNEYVNNYDSLGRLVEVKYNLDTIEEYEYNDLDLISKHRRSNVEVECEYDNDDNLLLVKRNGVLNSRLRYDEKGNTIRECDCGNDIVTRYFNNGIIKGDLEIKYTENTQGKLNGKIINNQRYYQYEWLNDYGCISAKDYLKYLQSITNGCEVIIGGLSGNGINGSKCILNSLKTTSYNENNKMPYEVGKNQELKYIIDKLNYNRQSSNDYQKNISIEMILDLTNTSKSIDLISFKNQGNTELTKLTIKKITSGVTLSFIEGSNKLELSGNCLTNLVLVGVQIENNRVSINLNSTIKTSTTILATSSMNYYYLSILGSTENNQNYLLYLMTLGEANCDKETLKNIFNKFETEYNTRKLDINSRSIFLENKEQITNSEIFSFVNSFESKNGLNPKVLKNLSNMKYICLEESFKYDDFKKRKVLTLNPSVSCNIIGYDLDIATDFEESIDSYIYGAEDSYIICHKKGNNVVLGLKYEGSKFYLVTNNEVTNIPFIVVNRWQIFKIKYENGIVSVGQISKTVALDLSDTITYIGSDGESVSYGKFCNYVIGIDQEINNINEVVIEKKYDKENKLLKRRRFVNGIEKEAISYNYDRDLTFDHVVPIISENGAFGNLNYSYDKKHRCIEKATYSASRKDKYTYVQNQLVVHEITEEVDEDGEFYDNQVYYEGFTYDNKGNITERRIGSNIKYTFEYDNKNRLVKYGNSEIITYDENNSMYIKTINGVNLIYEGSLLKSYGNNVYTYDNNGTRIKKVVNGVEIKYQLEGDRILFETEGNNYIEYLYDQDNQLIGLNRNNVIYYYYKDVLGTILGLVDSNGVIVCKYYYSAFGLHKVYNGNDVENLDPTFIGNINPFRYKSYYYDKETEFYYCKTRYYNPKWCRFISPDSINYLEPKNIDGLNLYSYCQNDPVNMVDPSGNAGFLGMLIITTILGAGIGAGIEVGKQFLTNDFSLNDFDWGSVSNSAIVGGALGLSLTMGVIFFGPAIAGVTAGTAATTTGLSVSGAFAISSAISFGAGAIGYSVEEWMNGRTPEFWKAMMHGGFVMIEGMVNFGVGGLIGSVGKIGTAGKPMLISAEWWGKWIFSKEFTKPLTITIDLLRNNL